MLTIERQNVIMDHLKNKKSVTVTELSKLFYIGEATIRRDLEKLEKMGLLKRTYGGAVSLDGLHTELPLSVRETEEKEAKNVIGQLAAELVHNGEIITLDSGSTTLKMIPCFTGKSELVAITNGARTAIELGKLLNVKVYCTGGNLRENSLSYIGEHARRYIENHYVDTLFFSCRGISIGKGVYEIDEEEAELRQIMINNAKKIVLLCDHTKFDCVSFCRICGFDKIDCLITDKNLSEAWMEYLKEYGTELLCGYRSV